MSAPLSEQGRSVLLGIARRAIECHLEGVAFEPSVREPELLQALGAFVTLKTADGELRGCIGHLSPEVPLARTIARVAVAAALEDPRFGAVTRDELDALRLEVSVLSSYEPIAPAAVEVGRHGLLIRCHGKSGLLLPQVAPEHGFDREAFLAAVCRKAGLPKDAWRAPDCELLGFTAEVFGEDD
ncbi:MAG: AmmeMemoRadiSam system protein A [Vicinamibacteria bacterium]